MTQETHQPQLKEDYNSIIICLSLKRHQ